MNKYYHANHSAPDFNPAVNYSDAEVKLYRILFNHWKANSGIKEGDHVLVERIAGEGDMGSPIWWNPKMDAIVGKVGVVVGFSPSGACVEFSEDGGSPRYIPFHVLRKAPRPARKWSGEVHIPSRSSDPMLVAVDLDADGEGGLVRVGCQFLSVSEWERLAQVVAKGIKEARG